MMASLAMTVAGPVDPLALGVTLPHEHTAISLWHIPSRWDYWELTRDEGLIVDELGLFRAAGGCTLVDLTLAGVGRDPAWLASVSKATGLNIVMGCGWYRGAYYPAEARIDKTVRR
jgi:predicted metal-dependent phosphotriesterase family hydrolase